MKSRIIPAATYSLLESLNLPSYAIVIVVILENSTAPCAATETLHTHIILSNFPFSLFSTLLILPLRNNQLLTVSLLSI